MNRLLTVLILVIATMKASATYTPVSQFPNNASPSNSIIILLTVPGLTNQQISIGQLMQFISTNSVVVYNLGANSNLQSAIALSPWFADSFASNSEYIVQLLTNTTFTTGIQSIKTTTGNPIILQDPTNGILTLANSYHYMIASSNASITTVTASSTDTNILVMAAFTDTLVISNASGSNIIFSYLGTGGKLTTTTTNALVIPSGRLAELFVEFYENCWTNYLTRLIQ